MFFIFSICKISLTKQIMNDKYLQYDLNSFLEDPDFIHEIKKGHPYKNKWEAFLKLHPELHISYSEAVRILTGVEFNKVVLEKENVDKIWRQIDLKISRRKRSGSIVRQIGFGAVAASILLLVYVAFRPTSATIVNSGNSEMISYLLPDKSLMKLNSNSSVTFNKKEWQKNRQVELEGEAFFSVKKGEKFKINSSLGEVIILGTSFNVYARESVFDVKCKSGRVLAITSAEDTFILSKGDALRFNDQTKKITNYQIRATNADLWTKGIYEYQNVSASLVFEEIQRQFGVDISYESQVNVEELHYTGVFDKKDLKKALHDVCWPLRLNYKIDNNSVRISDRKVE